MTPARCRVVVTGAAGFVGGYAVAALAERGVGAILGLGRGVMSGLSAPVEFRTLELSDREGLHERLAAFGPTHILHLAAQSSVGRAGAAAAETWHTNVVGLLNLAEAIRAAAPRATLLFASSSEVYGRSFLSGQPLTEEAALQPSGPYARSKRAGEEMLADVLAGTDVRLIVLRPFNHTGPGQTDSFVVASFIAQIVRMEAGLVPATLQVGNLDARREFLDVRDVARAYAEVILSSDTIPHGTALNIAGGTPRTIASIVEDLRGLARVPFDVAVLPDRMRPSDIPSASGTAARLEALTGWTPAIPWQQTLTDALASARSNLGETGHAAG